MHQNASTSPTLTIPDPDSIRAAISETDERARLLRRLLRLALRLRLHLTTGNLLPIPDVPPSEHEER